MKKVLSFLTLGIVIITFYGCTSSTPSNSPQEPKWLLKEVEYGAKYPYSEDGLSLYCEDSAIWLETVEGFKYALNSSATELLKNEKNYKGKTDLILKNGMTDLYTEDEALKICLPVTYQNYHQE